MTDFKGRVVGIPNAVDPVAEPDPSEFAFDAHTTVTETEPVPVAEFEPDLDPESPHGQAAGTMRIIWRRFKRDPVAMAALIFLLAVVVIAVFAPIFAPQDPNAQDLFNRYKGWSGAHPMGTDSFGRDVLSRVMYGARTSLSAALEALAIALVLGAPIGLLAGYFGGKIDGFLNWVSDAMMSMPALIVAFTIIAVLGNNLTNAMFAVGLVVAPRFFRIARASTLDVKNETYIESARCIGCSPKRIIFRHIVPNMITPLIVQASLTFGALILVEATLSFLGLGVQPPTSSWGAMIATAAQGIYTDKWAILAPGIVIVLTVLAFSVAGDALGDAIAPGAQREQL